VPKKNAGGGGMGDGLLSQPFRAGSNQKGPAAMPGRSLGAQDQSSFEVACIRRLVELGLKVVKGR
jgi:hypothetical protein